MADVMSATYPDLYAAVGVHSGLAYGLAQDKASAFAAMNGSFANQAGRPRRPGAHDRFPRTYGCKGASRQRRHILAQARAGLSQLSFETTQQGIANGLRYDRTVITDQAAPPTGILGDRGSGSCLVGRSPDGSHTEQRGPEASREMLRFFLDS